MKAYKTLSDPDDLRLFRPDLNMKRLSNSMHRLSCPGYDFDKEELIKCIAELVRVGKHIGHVSYYIWWLFYLMLLISNVSTFIIH